MPPPVARTSSQRSSRVIFALAAITALAAFLRFYLISRESLWYDEGFSVWLARRNFRSMCHIIARYEANMALYYLMLHEWLHFGESEAVVRALSALAGILTIPAIFALCRRLFNTRVALISALLLALNTFHIAYSQEARAYSFAVLFVTLASYFFVRAIELNSRRDWGLYVLMAVAASYCQFFVWPIFIAQWLSLSVLPRRRASWRSFGVSAAAVVFLNAPLIAHIFIDKTDHLSWIPRPTLSDLYKQLADFAGVQRNSLGALVIGLVLLVAIYLAIRDPESDSTGLARWRIIFLISWLLLPVLLTFGVSQWKPVFVDRYLIVSLPAFTILLSAALFRLPYKGLVAIALLAIVLSESQAIRSYEGTLVKEDWRGASAFVFSQQKPGDGFVFHLPRGERLFDYYARLRRHSWDADSVLLSDDDPSGLPMSALLTSHEHFPRIWLIQTRPIGSVPAPQDAAVRKELGRKYHEVFERSLRGVDITLYAADGSAAASSSPTAARSSAAEKEKAHSLPPGE